MAKIVKISPISKTYNSNFRTMESELSLKGYSRFPGTRRYFIPKKEADGRYRSGLDKSALYIKKLSEEEQKAEISFIDSTLAKLREVYPSTDFGPRSKVWSAFSDEDVKVSPVPIGTETIILMPDDDISQLLTYSWIRVDKGIARSLESYNRGECPDCQYYLANEESENKALYTKKKLINNAVVTFEGLTPTKQKQIARLMGLPIGDETTPESVYNLMDTTLKKPEFDSGEYKNLSTISIFNQLVSLTDERLKVKDLVEQAIRHSIYRKGTGDKIMEGSEIVSASKDDLVNRLLDDNNQTELMALETRVKTKKLATL